MRQFIVSLSLLGLFAALPAAALTYVRMTDGALADASPVIVEVEILGASQGRAGSLPVTEYRTEVRQILKGNVAAGELLVRVPGGEIEGGMSLHLWGAPAFKAGDQALLFLTPGSEGTFVINQLALGAFHLRADGADRWAVRDLKEATAMTRDGLPDLSVEAARDYDLFRRWLEDREAGLGRLPDYFAALPTWKLESIQDRFTLFETDGKNFRWQQFDEDDHVDWHAHEDGQPGLTGGGFSQFQAALAIWTDDAITNIDYRYGGTTDKTGGLTDPSGQQHHFRRPQQQQGHLRLRFQLRHGWRHRGRRSLVLARQHAPISGQGLYQHRQRRHRHQRERRLFPVRRQDGGRGLCP
jgi:hypothetical protein